MHNRWVAICLFGSGCFFFGLSMLHLYPRESHETADYPSPRTSWSSPNSTQRDKWFAYQHKLTIQAAGYNASPNGRLILLGDSITEAWRGTSYDTPTKRAEGVPKELQAVGQDRWQRPLVLAISGDQTQHLLWRLQHGELSDAMAADPSAVFVLLIGTNNLGRGYTPDETWTGVMAVVHYLLAHSKGKLLVTGLLPRGDGPAQLPKLCPPRCRRNGEPYSSFNPAVDRVNLLVERSLGSLGSRFPSRMRFADCSHPFRVPDEAPNRSGAGAAQVRKVLMPDLLHPNKAGMHLLGRCLFANLVELEAGNT